MAVIVEVQESDDGEMYVEIPDDVLESVGWVEGDCLEWSLRGDSLLLSKIGDPADFIDDAI
jgi:antitoxin component of MazEF toxin-antitoxin module